MKKIINSVFVLGMLAMAFTSCEDVPAPFNTDFNGGAEQVVVAPAGEGTLESPYNVAKALDIVKKGAQSTAKVYAKGIITKIDGIDTNYGNANYHLADTKGGKPTLQVYRGNYYGGKKFTTGQEINVGDTLLITGVLTIYNGTPQFGQGSQIVTINGKADSNANSDLSTAAPTGDGTAASPYNVAKAQSVLATLEADKPTDSVYIAGTVVGTPEINVQFGNATFLLSDDKSGRLSVYRGKYLQGSRFTATDQLKEGDKVVIFGALVNYKGNTPQVSKDSRMVSHNGKTVAENTGTGGATDSKLSINDTIVTATNPAVTAGATTVTIDLDKQGLANNTEVKTLSLSDGSTITFGAGENTKYPPKFVTAGNVVRMYANNTLSFACKAKIAKIVFTCVSYNGTKYVGNQTATITFDGNNATYTNKFTAASGGTQLRVQSIAVTYAN